MAESGPLAVVTATLDGKEFTQRLVAELSEVNNRIPLRLIVADQGSADGTVEWLTSLGPGVQAFLNERNLGVATAWNQGLRFAIQQGMSAVLVCGNDTVPQPGTVERLYRLINKGVAFVTGTQVAYDAPREEVPIEDDAAPLVAAPDFSCFMLNPIVVVETVGRWDAAFEQKRRDQWIKEGSPGKVLNPFSNPWTWGLFDEQYVPAYFEDNDFHLRMRLAGIPALRDPYAFFRHECSQTVASHPQLQQQNQTTFARNADYFKRKWGKLPHELEIPQARPPNVTDEQWLQINGGDRPIQEVDRQSLLAQAKETYSSYGIAT
jgi:GT2 family glycosyltransferase